MLEEKEIIGKTQVKINKNKKIKLPDFISFKPGDIVIPRLNIKQDRVIISSEKKYEELGKKLDNFIIQEKDNIPGKKLRLYKRIFYGKLSTEKLIIDKNKTIKLHNKFINNLKLTDKAFIVGYKDYLELYPSEEYYNEIKKR